MSFHSDMTCGACKGPLEDDRTAICHTCAPESQWFDQLAAIDTIKKKYEEAKGALARHSADANGRPCPCQTCIEAKEVIAIIDARMGR